VSPQEMSTLGEGSRKPPKLERGPDKGAAVHRSSFRLTFLRLRSPRPWGCEETRHLGRLAARGSHDPGPAINRRFRKLRPKRRVRGSRDRPLETRARSLGRVVDSDPWPRPRLRSSSSFEEVRPLARQLAVVLVRQELAGLTASLNGAEIVLSRPQVESESASDEERPRWPSAESRGKQ
jgi:hypothetical protein